MTYVERTPSEPLRRHVEVLWYLSEGSDGAAPVQRIVPDGRSELIFHFGATVAEETERGSVRQARTLFAGQLDGPLLLRPEGAVDMAGVRLRPFGGYSLFGLPGRELAGRVTDASAAIPATADWLDELANLPGAARLARLDALLLGRLERGRPVASKMIAAAVAIQAAPLRSTADIARSLGMTPRQLQRSMREMVGIGPKMLGRITRFQDVLLGLPTVRRGELAALAMRAGYADQPHLNRDFRQFTGLSPSAYLRECTDWSDQFSSG